MGSDSTIGGLVDGLAEHLDVVDINSSDT